MLLGNLLCSFNILEGNSALHASFLDWARGHVIFPNLSNQIEGLVFTEFQIFKASLVGLGRGYILAHRSPQNISRISCHLPTNPVAHQLEVQPVYKAAYRI